MISSFIQVLDSPCTTGDCRSTIGACCKYFWIYFNLYKYSHVLYMYKTAGFGCLAFQSHFREKCCCCTATLSIIVFAKIMNNLFWGFMLNLYTHASSLCCMVLLGTSPTSFYWILGEVQFFFSGLSAGPTYRPPVRHSNPDTPLLTAHHKVTSVRHDAVIFCNKVMTV